ncbi:class I SAM-dependent methyltransferase [Spirosoma utsteinense]|uniref:SAM-dependent MidA family methyltransferase n=1 Tax=Spirosoma utsteinense TaxID=2585773 RepID=A0ABR6W5N7_9BACT|nr:SAM-dependent methyltransferase [Spirosoma utsteinense]MBC3789053.1 SAM-dependent MidA family methyltransferase [Spirosoma utsteinense]MBC3791110.1 SAM-dependent MidA family methyltransferase [Spirosoma utsteinense]
MTLPERIIQKIKQQGPIPFQEFMEMCLYYPGLGYYTSPATKIGPTGDFYTSSCLTPVFGALIGKQLEEMWVILGKEPFTIVEYGAGTGALCADILLYLKNNASLYDQLRYCIIEKSPVMQAIERSHLTEKVSWHESIEDIPDISGCILSNELVDTFAVHPVLMDQQLMEVFVDYTTSFQEVLQPASRELTNYLNELDVRLSPGYRTEINLQAVRWIQTVATALKRGYVMTIDYGFESADLYKPGRSQGTLRCYRNHTTNTNLYEQIGSQDITTYINFSALAHWGAKQGLTKCGLTNQSHFLLAMGLIDSIEQAYAGETDIVQAARNVARIRHTLLVDMGPKFNVLIQQKGVAGQCLSGLSLLREATS